MYVQLESQRRHSGLLLRMCNGVRIHIRPPSVTGVELIDQSYTRVFHVLSLRQADYTRLFNANVLLNLIASFTE